MTAAIAAAVVLLLVLYEASSAGAQPAATPSSNLGSLTGLFGGGMGNQATITAIANAITNQEGVPGDRNYRNNNPGNLKPPNGAANYWPGQVGVDAGGFAIFDSWQDGMAALQTDVAIHIQENPDQTLTEWFASYSPDSTGLSGAYGAAIAAALGVSPDTQLGAL